MSAADDGGHATLAEIARRLAAIERAVHGAEELRQDLAREVEARRRLGEQTVWLLEQLGEARKEIRWLRARLEGKGTP